MITVPRTGQSGVALLSVLWATMLIAGLFAALSLRVRGFAMTQSALEQRIRAGYAVEDATIRYFQIFDNNRFTIETNC